MDTAPTPAEGPQGPTPNSLDGLDLHARLARSNRAGVCSRSVTFDTTLAQFDAGLRAGVHDEGLSPQFPDISYAGKTYSLLPLVAEETGDGSWYRSSRYVGLPALAPGWERRHIRAEVTDGSDRYDLDECASDGCSSDGHRIHTQTQLVCLITMRPTLAGGLTGTVEYLDFIEPWIEALLRDAGVTWNKAEPAAAQIGNGSALKTGRAIGQCPFCAEYEGAVTAWAHAHVGAPTYGAAPTWEDIAVPLLTGGESLRKRCQRHAARGAGHEAATYNPRELLQTRGLL